jgi:predicted nucleotidyltransferase
MAEDPLETQHRNAEKQMAANPGMSLAQALPMVTRRMNAAYRAKKAVDGIAENRPNKRVFVGFGRAR